jgi:hypothetical protein
MRRINRVKRLVSTTIITLAVAVGSTERTWAVTAAVPTAGIAVTSFVVGAAGATESALEETRSKWNRKFLGFGSLLLMGIDPDPATYIEGTTVIAFPDELLEFQELTWYDKFSDMSTGDTGPVCDEGCMQGSGFFNNVSVFTPQPPNPAISFTTSVNDGFLTVSWSADPGIVTEDEPMNIFGIVFKSISEKDLYFEIESPESASANLYQDTAAQSLTCIPPDETEPQPCGYPDEPIKFSVTTVPEPTSAFSFLAFSTLGAASTLKRKLKSSQSSEKELEKLS